MGFLIGISTGYSGSPLYLRMLNRFRSLSLQACLLLLAVALVFRFGYFTNNAKNGYNATTWDALGYYMYLPGLLIYDDVKELKWFPEIDEKYHVSGGQLYQATSLEKGGYAFKYLGGVAIMELPFFYIGHGIAALTDAPQDGFSWPYQYAIIFGAIFWFFVGCLILRKVLLRFYDERVTMLTLLLIGLASNLLQYVSVDGAMSHVFIFPLYALVLWLTLRWHESPSAGRAAAIGLVIGLATISRPTELIMVFIPLLWGLDGTGKLRTKWQLARKHLSHAAFAAAGGIIGILPQLLYWKHATGSFVYDVGSKWYFLNPWFRVLFGFEKGWFIYTPIALFMVAGLFFLKGKPFRKAVITFCLLNIWIIIAWSDWRYGASYSTRALTQSYPVFALALGAFLERFFKDRKRWIIVLAGGYLCGVNLFQIWQYNAGILHYDHMNGKYYAAIYLDRDPEPLDYSLLDTDELMNNTGSFIQLNRHTAEGNHLEVTPERSVALVTFTPEKATEWLTSELKIWAGEGIEYGQLVYICRGNNETLAEKRFRLATPRSKNKRWMTYQEHVRIPGETDTVFVRFDAFGDMKVKSYHFNAVTWKPE